MNLLDRKAIKRTASLHSLKSWSLEKWPNNSWSIILFIYLKKHRIISIIHILFDRLTQKIYKKLTDEDLPHQLGTKYKLRCPALEFVKYTCKLLSLDKNITNQVIKLKKDLLTIVNVREFSDEAQFVDPSLSFVIPQILCLKCNHSRDLDLCKDPCSNLDENDQSKQYRKLYLIILGSLNCHFEYLIVYKVMFLNHKH